MICTYIGRTIITVDDSGSERWFQAGHGTSGGPAVWSEAEAEEAMRFLARELGYVITDLYDLDDYDYEY